VCGCIEYFVCYVSSILLLNWSDSGSARSAENFEADSGTESFVSGVDCNDLDK